MYSLNRLIIRTVQAFVCALLVGQCSITVADDVDALLNHAQHQGNQRLKTINQEVRNRLETANTTHNEYFQEVNNQLMSNNLKAYGYSGGLGLTSSGLSSSKVSASIVKKLEFTQNMVNNTSCRGDYSQLAPLLKNYYDPELQAARSSILNEDVATLIRNAKSMAGTREKAMEMSRMQAAAYDQTVSDAAGASSQTWGGPGEDPVAQLNGGRLPLNIQCRDSMPYISICAAVMSHWGSMASLFTVEILKKCW